MGVFIGECEVLENRRAAEGTYVLRLRAPDVAAAGRPGQFVMVRTGPEPEKGGGPLLKRPFSVHRYGPGPEISLLYQVVGVGTRLLAQADPGDRLEVLGPLGRGFSLPPMERACLVAGGMGVAPMPALIDALAGRTEVLLLYGALGAPRLVTTEDPEFFGLGVDLRVSTDDGSAGRKGFVTELLAGELDREPLPVFACGPMPMLARVAELARSAGAPAQVSLEAHMACGMGACLGCTTPVHSPNDEPAYARVCMEGPVFSAEEVLWPASRI